MISLSPLRTAHPNPFQRKPVRPSSRFYPTFSLAMRRSQSFASAPTDSGALFRLAFAPARGIHVLNLASEEQLVGSLCKRHAVTLMGSHSLQARGFRYFFTPLSAVLFTFPSRYWYTIGLPGVFSLGGWCRRIQAGFLRSRPTQDTASHIVDFAYGTVTLFGITFQKSSAIDFVSFDGPTTPTLP